MSSSLQRQIQAIARRAWRLLFVHGLCWFVAVMTASALVLGWTDYSLRLQDRGVRIILSLVFGLTLLESFRRFVVPAIRRRFDDLEVAQQVERRFPQLDDRLSSSLEFLDDEASANQAESASLRKMVISETEALVRPLKLDDCLDSRATRRALLACLPLLIGVGVFFALDFEATSLAARRLAIPWSREAWPRWNSLEFVRPPSRIALGHDFAVEVIDARGRLPKETKLQFWFDGDAQSDVETVAMQRGEDNFRYTRGNVTRSFQYRAIGGDDDSMQWRSLDVVEPARAVDVRIAVQPPPYSGIASAVSPAGPIRILAGSQIVISGRTTRPVQSVRFHFGEGDDDERDIGIAGRKSTFSISGVPTDIPGKGEYWIELIEADGVVSGSDTRASWEIVADHAPTVTVLAPTTEIYFTPTATVPIRVTATDNLAVQSLQLQIGTTTIPLFVGPAHAAARDDLPSHPDVREITRELDLSEFQLAPNDSLELVFTASDYKPQTSERVTRSITIISREDFDYRSQEKQKLLLVRLVEALRLQRATRSQVASLQTQLDTVDALSEEDASLLRASEIQQQQVARLLDDSPGGAAQLIAELIASLVSNDMGGSDAAARMDRLAKTLNLVNRERMPDLQSEFVRATKVIRLANDERDDRMTLLTSVGDRQDAIAVDLQSMIDQLSQWDDYRRFAQDVSKLLRDQQQLSAEVDQLPTIGQRFETLSPQQRADLERAAGKQSELARRLDRLQTEMDRLRQKIHESDSAAATLAEALRRASTNDIAEQMREIGNDVARNRLGNAAQAQKDVEQGLEQVLGALTESTQAAGNPAETPNSEQLAAALKVLKTQLDDITSRQQILMAATSEWRDSGTSSLAPAQMAREQQQLADDTQAVREQASIPKTFAFGLSSIEPIMRDAATRLQRDAPDERVYQLQSRALSRLQQILSALTSVTPRENPSHADNETTSPSSNDKRPALSLEELRLLHAMQLDLHERTVAIEQKRQAGGALDDAETQELQQLATEQGQLAELLTEAVPANGGIDEPASPVSPDEFDDFGRILRESSVPGVGVDP